MQSSSPVRENPCCRKAGDAPARRACLVCGKRGVDGPVVLGKRLCANCERAIVNLDAGARDYDFYVAKIRQAWRSYLEARQRLARPGACE